MLISKDTPEVGDVWISPKGIKIYITQVCRCPLESALLMYDGKIKKSIALKIGFDEQGNPPSKLKCYRKYKKKFTDKLTGSLL